MNKTIAVDGPAGSGKSSIAKLLADKIGFSYFDTGLVYRALTYYFLGKEVSSRDEANVELELGKLNLDVKENKILINNQDITELLKTDVINAEVTNYAKLKKVRKYIQFIQKRFAMENNCVMDGRDIGTIVFPDAFCKFYLDADVEERSKRRLNEINKTQQGKTLAEVKKEIIIRDHLDRTRKESPLKISPEAIVIDSSKLNINEVLIEMINHFNHQVNLNRSNYLVEKSNEFFLNALDNFSKDKANIRSKNGLNGKVISLGKDEIILDVGEKSDAYIDIEESKKILAEKKLQVGDEIEVVFLGNSSRGLRVSKLIAEKNKSKLLIQKAFQDNLGIEGKVVKVIKGGFIVSISGNLAFCPYSEFDLKNINSEKQIGKILNFNILENKGNKLVLSRKKIVEEIYKQNKKDFFSKITVGMLLEGKVVAHIMGGVLLEIKEGVVLLLKNEDISWGYNKNAGKKLKKNQVIEVKVVNFDPEALKIRISRKDLEADPFIGFSQVYKEGDIVKGKVGRIENFGVFLNLDENLDGLLHVSNLSWYRKVEHPSQVVKKDQELKVKILKIDSRNRRVSLGLREVETNPWDGIEKRYPVGSVVMGKVNLITLNGVYLVINDKIEGYIHVSNTKYNNEEDLRKKIKEGDALFGIIKDIQKPKRRFELILKEKSEDPWGDFEKKIKQELVVTGKVIEILENGINVLVFGEIIGFCYKSQISEKSEVEGFDLNQEIKVGEFYNFKIQSFNLEKKILKLSRKDYLLENKEVNINQYLKNNKKEKFTLSDMIKKK